MKTKLHTATLALSCFIVGFVTCLLCLTHQPQSVPNNAAASVPLIFTGQLVRLPAGTLQNILYGPASAQPIDSDQTKGIEPAERHNLYQMQRYHERVLESMDVPQTRLPSSLNEVLDIHK